MGPVTVLTKPGCTQCRMTMKVLDDRAVEYLTIDITESSATLEWAEERGFMAAPIVIVGDMGDETFDA